MTYELFVDLLAASHDQRPDWLLLALRRCKEKDPQHRLMQIGLDVLSLMTSLQKIEDGSGTANERRRLLRKELIHLGLITPKARDEIRRGDALDWLRLVLLGESADEAIEQVARGRGDGKVEAVRRNVQRCFERTELPPPVQILSHWGN